jgi:hypothetical protein
LNSLAAYNIKEGAKEKEKGNKDEYSQAAIALFNKADSIDQMFEMTWVLKGVRHLLVGELQSGKRWFDNALDINTENLPAILGKVRKSSSGRGVSVLTARVFTFSHRLAFFSEMEIIRMHASCTRRLSSSTLCLRMRPQSA